MPRFPLAWRCLLGAALAGLATPAAWAAEAGSQSGEAVDAGLRIAWRYAAAPGAPGVGMLEIGVSDAATGGPVRYARGALGAWLQRRRATLAEAETSCADRVAAIRNPRALGRRTDVDIDTSRILTLNADGTLAVINPFVGLNNAKLEGIVALGGAPRAWLQLPDRTEAWVALAGPARLVAVDLKSLRIARAIDLPAGDGQPLLAWDAAGQRLHVAVAGHAGLGQVDPARPEAPLLALPGPAPVALFADAEGTLAGVVSLHADGDVLHWTEGQARRLWHAAAQDGVPRLARYSPLARRLVVATERGVLALADPGAAGGPAATLALGHAVRALELLDGGRWAMLLGDGRASLVDLATGAIALRLDAPEAADRLVLTEAFAYAVSLATGRARLWPLAGLRRGTAEPVDVTIGPPDPEAGADATGPLVVPTAARDGLLVAGPAEGVIRQYGEGQMAYRGELSNYRRAALALGVLDMGLREVAPGRYRAPVRHAAGGPHVLVLAGAGPRFAACGQVALAALGEADGAPAAALRAERLEGDGIRIRLVDAAAGGAAVGGVPDLILLLFDPRSGQSRRLPLRERADAPGEYEARLGLPPGAGHYDAMVASASRGLSFDRNPVGAVGDRRIAP